MWLAYKKHKDERKELKEKFPNIKKPETTYDKLVRANRNIKILEDGTMKEKYNILKNDVKQFIDDN